MPRKVKFIGTKRKEGWLLGVGDKQGGRAALQTGTQFVVISLEDGEWVWLHRSGKQ